jgi:hypothetical protein
LQSVSGQDQVGLVSYDVLITAHIVLIMADVRELVLIGVNVTDMTEHDSEMTSKGTM